jgi:hypothetical protein
MPAVLLGDGRSPGTGGIGAAGCGRARRHRMREEPERVITPSWEGLAIQTAGSRRLPPCRTMSSGTAPSNAARIGFSAAAAGAGEP